MTLPLPDLRPDSLLLTRRSRLVLFVCIAVLGYILTGLLTTVMLYKFGSVSARVLRVAALAQDMLALIAPAVVTAMMVTRLPAQLLELRGGVRPAMWGLALAVVPVATPAMNWVIEANANIEATGALSAFVDKLRTMEENAEAMITVMQGSGTWGDLILNILIIGVAAGFSEELFFRGALQRLLSTGGVNAHASIWIAAAVFSAVHMQFFGFVPRLLLGAYFGYLLLWSRSIWLPAAAHALNNTIYVTAQWIYQNHGTPAVTVDNIGLGKMWPLAIVSAIATAFMLRAVARRKRE
ncbi:MAG: CPBP family intramembrane metalloprotease [Muribaculaceae bacterium]|nr:CPBP family intramembrane metalloprotease [Muribaculaceae bacterium]